MADPAEKEKAEKLAAAKKRVEQLKKQKGKGKQAGAKAEKQPKEEAPEAVPEEKAQAADEDTADNATTADAASSSTPAEDGTPAPETAPSHAESPTREPHKRQPSMSAQSRLRSTSFRKSSGGYAPTSPTSAASGKGPSLPALSPEGDAVTEIYRKQAARLEELERENKRLAKELETAEARWHKSEEELEELREGEGQVAGLRTRAEKADTARDENMKLKSELTALQRQNAHLQSASHRPNRRSTSPGQAPAAGGSPNAATDLQTQLDSKTATIESMELEISNLRAAQSKASASRSSHTEQVGALQAKLERAETAAGAAQRELLEARRNLERASAKAVAEGTARTSADTAQAAATRDAAAATQRADEAGRRLANLEKKLAALTTLHREADARRRESERAEREALELRRRAEALGRENARLKEERERKRAQDGRGGGQDDDAMDELEDEERRRLEGRVRELESELFEAKRGAWQERRKELGEGAMDDAGFDEVDLSGGAGPVGRRASARQSRSGGLAGALASGLGAITGTAGSEQRKGSLPLLDDDDDDFDEDAFRQAREEEARKRVERVKELKRGLQEWKGYRLDIVDVRTNGGGMGEIFDI